MKLSWGWAFDGVNASIPRNTGPECSEYLSIKRHWIEGVIVCFMCCCALKWAVKNAKPLLVNYSTVHSMTAGKQLLQIIMTFTLGMELGFKLSQRSVIYILNPCHITSIIQVSGTWFSIISIFSFPFVTNSYLSSSLNISFNKNFLFKLFGEYEEWLHK